MLKTKKDKPLYTEKYFSIKIGSASLDLLREEKKQSFRPIYVEATMLIREACLARAAQREAEEKKKK